MTPSGRGVELPSMRPAHLAAALGLLLFVLLLYSRLLFTNRVLASGDILHYFYPYRDYAAAALREGRIPLWNPYIFLGVPFLANPQAAVLYPLHWPLSWLSVTKQIYWSAAVHSWILGFGGYLLMRHWGFSGGSGFVTGLILAGSGFYGGLIGHINQMNGAAWLPWCLLVIEQVARAGTSAARSTPRVPVLLTGTLFFSLLTALMLLAGHTQTLYINLFGVGLWIIWPLVSPEMLRHPRARMQRVLPSLSVYALGVLLGAGLSAAQLLPTLELTGLGLRSGGLSYQEVTSFSLRPLQLPWTLLPSYGLVDLRVIFATLGYSEFVAYVGLAGLLLAALGAWAGRGQRAWSLGLLFAVAGLFLALGRWNPFYYLLYKLVPGFDLFRTPARWMMLYTLGMAVLAGIGWREVVKLGTPRWSTGYSPWAVVAVLALDLLLAARALPHTQTTAPQAVYDVRTAPAHLLTDPARLEHGPAAGGRFLSMSAITFDPGDMADYRRIFLERDPPQLDARAFADFVVAVKSQEILAPNLPLFWRVPAVDGFDGGLLPLQRYLRFLTLFVPPEQLVPDGRLREQLSEMPSTWLLNLVNARYVITDKVRDLWFDGVYYDRQIGARLDRSTPELTIGSPLPFEATHIDLIGYAERPDQGPFEGLPVAEVMWAAQEAEQTALTDGALKVVAGADFADGALDSRLAAASGATVAYRDVENGREEYLVRLALPEPQTPATVTVRLVHDAVPVVIRAVTLYDDRSGMFAALLPSDRGEFQQVHSGDVKIYANREAASRLALRYDWRPVADVDEAVDLLASGAVDSARTALVETVAELPYVPESGPAVPGMVELLDYRPERVVARVVTASPALLILTDTYYPGWRARVGDRAAAVYPVNGLMRGIFVPAGEQIVTVDYAPASWRRGLLVSGLSGGIVALLALTAIALHVRGRHRG